MSKFGGIKKNFFPNLTVRLRITLACGIFLNLSLLCLILVTYITVSRQYGFNHFSSPLFIGYIVITILIVFLFSLFLWNVLGKALKPLEQIISVAKLASEGNLRCRIGAVELDSDLYELSEAFDKMLDKLELSFNSYRRFAANASHELRTPLAINQTLLEVALDNKEISKAELLKNLERVYEINSKNIKIVESLLQFASLSQKVMNKSSVNLATLVKKCVSYLEEKLVAQNISCDISKVTPESYVFGDRILLNQLVNNLLLNAIRYNKFAGYINVEIKDVGKKIILVITNSGNFVEKAKLSSLTEPFFRATLRTAEDKQPCGFGLGLALVENIVESHGGELWIEQNPLGGLIVAFSLEKNKP